MDSVNPIGPSLVAIHGLSEFDDFALLSAPRDRECDCGSLQYDRRSNECDRRSDSLDPGLLKMRPAVRFTESMVFIRVQESRHR